MCNPMDSVLNWNDNLPFDRHFEVKLTFAAGTILPGMYRDLIFLFRFDMVYELITWFSIKYF